MENQNLLFELGCEELPPKSLGLLSLTLLENIKIGLETAGLDYSDCKAFATPRRLAVLVQNLAACQTDKSVEKRGPSLQAAFNTDGSPSKAAQGFASSCGTSVEKLGRIKTAKGEWLAFNQEIKGTATEVLLPDIIRNSLNNLPIAKRMRWGSSAVEFVRPVHWAVLLFGSQTIKTKILGIDTGNTTLGHRFHFPSPIALDSADDYEKRLKNQGKVIADIEQRKSLIKSAANDAASQLGGKAHIEDDLLEEIAALNEWPVPVVGNFDIRFLKLPVEVLITTMQSNQKYFPIQNDKGKLLPHFITFCNIESTRIDSVQQGNERVIMPRLADAEFFWKQDTKLKLDDRINSLHNIVFQKKLGTMYDKTERIVKLAAFIANKLNKNIEHAKRAAQLAKTDLITEMVGEFASLQGIMGRYYALQDGETNEVALALEEQYFPKQSGSPTPTSSTGQILSIAEKIDTLCGIFSTGLIPTGDKDPYALRRASLGILRTIIENKLDLDLNECIDFTINQLQHEFAKATTKQSVSKFINERLKSYVLEQEYTADEFEAVLAVKPSKPLDFMQRLQAVKAFRQLPEAESLSAANKRIRNILKKSSDTPAELIANLSCPEEIQLLSAAQKASNEIQAMLDNRDYHAVLERLSQLHYEIDNFFDHVMVMTEDIELRKNRLGLLQFISGMFLKIADISKFQS